MLVAFEICECSVCCCKAAEERLFLRRRLLIPCTDFRESEVDLTEKPQFRSGRSSWDFVVGV